MQKFGLQTNRSSQHNAIELEIAREQATALGRAGRKLRVSLERYEERRYDMLSEKEQQGFIREISENATRVFRVYRK